MPPKPQPYPQQSPHIAARCHGSNFEDFQKPIAASVYPLQKPPGELFFISIGDLLTWVDFSVHLRLLPYLRILTSRTRTLGALAACGTERGVSCESNAVSTTSWFDREGILPQQSNPPTAPRQPPHIAARCRGSNFEDFQKPIAASVSPSHEAPGCQFSDRSATF